MTCTLFHVLFTYKYTHKIYISLQHVQTSVTWYLQPEINQLHVFDAIQHKTAYSNLLLPKQITNIVIINGKNLPLAKSQSDCNGSKTEKNQYNW